MQKAGDDHDEPKDVVYWVHTKLGTESVDREHEQT
jgi:hypothetical protein